VRPLTPRRPAPPADTSARPVRLHRLHRLPCPRTCNTTPALQRSLALASHDAAAAEYEAALAQLPQLAVAATARPGALRSALAALPAFPLDALLASGPAGQPPATAGGTSAAGSPAGAAARSAGGPLTPQQHGAEMWRAYQLLSFLAHVSPSRLPAAVLPRAREPLAVCASAACSAAALAAGWLTPCHRVSSLARSAQLHSLRERATVVAACAPLPSPSIRTPHTGPSRANLCRPRAPRPPRCATPRPSTAGLHVVCRQCSPTPPTTC
jgi:hypothetical protein